MDEAKASNTPMSTTTKLCKDESGKLIDEKRFIGMIFKYLLYLIASRPDIIFATCLYDRFQSCPQESHLNIVKRIFKYLIRTFQLGVWYPRSDSFDLISYSDADFVGSLLNRNSTFRTH